jgi:hypothetical protein
MVGLMHGISSNINSSWEHYMENFVVGFETKKFQPASIILASIYDTYLI